MLLFRKITVLLTDKIELFQLLFFRLSSSSCYVFEFEFYVGDSAV